jgi:hypothetical protein
MEGILKFNLPEEETEFKMAVNVSNYFTTLWDMDQWLRSNTKHAPDSTHEEAVKAYYKCRDHLRELMSDNNLNFD